MSVRHRAHSSFCKEFLHSFLWLKLDGVVPSSATPLSTCFLSPTCPFSDSPHGILLSLCRPVFPFVHLQCCCWCLAVKLLLLWLTQLLDGMQGTGWQLCSLNWFLAPTQVLDWSATLGAWKSRSRICTCYPLLLWLCYEHQAMHTISH